LPRDVSDRNDIADEQDDVGGVELPRALEDTGCSDQGAAFQHDFCENGRCGVARNEDEQIRRPAEAIVSGRDQVHRIVGNMIEKQETVRDPQEQIRPEVLVVGGEIGFEVHAGCCLFLIAARFARDRDGGRSCRDLTICPRCRITSSTGIAEIVRESENRVPFKPLRR